MEEEEYREKVENLKHIQEGYRMIALGEEPSDEDSDNGDY